MSDEPDRDDAAPGPAEPSHTEVTLAYEGVSTLVGGGDAARLALAGNVRRDPVRLEATIKDPLRFREAMSALFAVVAGDSRYVPRDRTAYLAYKRMRRESDNLDAWQAQRAYFSWLLRNDPTAFLILDPVVTVHPDRVSFEVFSKDEGTYAALGIDRDAFDVDGEPTYGTTNIDFSRALYAGLQQMRSYRRTRLEIGREGVRFATAAAGEVLEKHIRVPDSWLRGFLQVQSAAALPREVFALAPIDRVQRAAPSAAARRPQGPEARRAGGAGARREAAAGAGALGAGADGLGRGVQGQGGPRGADLGPAPADAARSVPAVRRGGRGAPAGQRPAELLGPPRRRHDPDPGPDRLHRANWSQALSFDLLLPRKTQETGGPLAAVLDHLHARWSAGAGELARATGLEWPALIEALQRGCQQGRVMYDLAADVYRLRPLTDAPLDMGRLEFRDRRERIAHDLLVRREAVQVVSEDRIPGTGLELTGRVVVAEDRREYRPQMLLGDEGQVSRAECTCAEFRKQGLKAGPCVHLVALRLSYAEQEARRARGLEPRQAITAETRTYTRRDPAGEEVYQVSLERRRVKVRWGRTGQPMRLQTSKFDTVEGARGAYLARIAALDARGFLDATAG
jgi:predicted DNA-binding WGR domain protein